MTRANFAGLKDKEHVIVLGNGIKATASYVIEQANMVGDEAAMCTDAANCLAWQTAAPSKTGGRVRHHSCYVLRSATHAWYAGGMANSFSYANNFGQATNSDDGQELVPNDYVDGAVITRFGSNGGINTRSADPPSRNTFFYIYLRCF